MPSPMPDHERDDDYSPEKEEEEEEVQEIPCPNPAAAKPPCPCGADLKDTTGVTWVKPKWKEKSRVWDFFDQDAGRGQQRNKLRCKGR